MSQRYRFLIASEDLTAAEALGAVLFEAGFAGRRVDRASEALAELDREAYDVVIADHALRDLPGGALLRQEEWPGNVRQLQNFVERLVVMGKGPRISADDVKRELGRAAGALGFAEATGLAPKLDLDQSALELEVTLKKAERRALERALKSAAGNKNVAARLLGISRRSLYYKLEEHGLQTPDDKA